MCCDFCVCLILRSYFFLLLLISRTKMNILGLHKANPLLFEYLFLRRQQQALCYSVVGPYVCCPLRPILCDEISHLPVTTNIRHASRIAQKVFKVKSERSRSCVYDVTLSLSSSSFYLFIKTIS